VMCQGRGRKAQMGTDVADPKAVIPRLDQKAKDRKPGVVAKGSKG